MAPVLTHQFYDLMSPDRNGWTNIRNKFCIV